MHGMGGRMEGRLRQQGGVVMAGVFAAVVVDCERVHGQQQRCSLLAAANLSDPHAVDVAASLALPRPTVSLPYLFCSNRGCLRALLLLLLLLLLQAG